MSQWWGTVRDKRTKKDRAQYCSSSEDEDNMKEYWTTKMELSRDFLSFSHKAVEETTFWKFWKVKLLLPIQMLRWRNVEKWWSDVTGEVLSTQIESGRSPTSSTTKLIRSGLGSNPVLRSVKPATKRMCRRKAYCTDCKKAVHTALEYTADGSSFLGENSQIYFSSRVLRLGFRNT